MTMKKNMQWMSRADDALFTLSERGIVTLTDECGTDFAPLATGNHRYQKPGSKVWFDAMLEKIREYNRMR